MNLESDIQGANATTLAAGSSATATIDSNKTLQLGIPRGADGANGQDAYNPFKGWYTSSSALPANPVVGDYAYVKGAETTDPAAIYECTTDGTWSDSGKTADTSNVQTFASSQEVNEVHIVNDLITGGADDVLSAEQGKKINTDIGGKHFLRTIEATAGFQITRTKSLLTVDIKASEKVRIRLLSLYNVFASCALYGNNESIVDVSDLTTQAISLNRWVYLTASTDISDIHIYVASNKVLESGSISLAVEKLGIKDDVSNIHAVVASGQNVNAPNIIYSAHRTMCLDEIAPENSIDGVRLAARAGFDFVEFDVLKTSDGYYVCSHLNKINDFYRNASDYSTITNDVFISSSTFSDLRNNYVMKSPNIGMRRQIPTLAEMLTACKIYGIKPAVDCKITGEQDNQYIIDIISLIKEYYGNDYVEFATRSNIARLYSQNLICGPVSESIPNATDSVINNIISTYANNEGKKVRTSYAADLDNANFTLSNVNRFLQNNITFGVYVSGQTANLDEYLQRGVCDITADNIAPKPKDRNSCFSASLNTNDILTDGIIANGILQLDKDKLLRIVNQPQDLYFAGVYIQIDMEGEASLTCGGIAYNGDTDTVDIIATQRRTVTYQYIIHNRYPSFRLLATSNCKIYSISYNIIPY